MRLSKILGDIYKFQKHSIQDLSSQNLGLFQNLGQQYGSLIGAQQVRFACKFKPDERLPRKKDPWIGYDGKLAPDRIIFGDQNKAGNKKIRRVARTNVYPGLCLKPLTAPLETDNGISQQTGVRYNRARTGAMQQRKRFVDHRRQIDLPAKVVRMERDPQRSAWINLVEYDLGDDYYAYSYQLAPQDVQHGTLLQQGPDAPPTVGNFVSLEKLEPGTEICNIENRPGKGGTIARAAGTFATLLKPNSRLGYAIVRLPSGQIVRISKHCKATVGKISNPLRQYEHLGKAGAKRRWGFKVYCKGQVMSSSSHPHGGGQRSGIVLPLRTKWGKVLGTKTRPSYKPTNKYIVAKRMYVRYLEYGIQKISPTLRRPLNMKRFDKKQTFNLGMLNQPKRLIDWE